MQKQDIYANSDSFYDSLDRSRIAMWRIYLIGVIYALIVFNIPEIRDDTIARIQLYRPKAEQIVTNWRDKYTPALRSIIDDLKKTPQKIIDGKIIDIISNTAVDTSDDWTLDHKPSITAEQFDAILRDYKSPAVGLGATVTVYAQRYDIDNAYVLYMFIHESTAGTAGVAVHTNGAGNIKCTDTNCYQGFQVYSSWEEGFKALIDLLVFYRDNLGDKTIIQALQRWAPASENDQRLNCDQQQNSYPCGLMANVSQWRKVNAVQPKVATTFAKAEPITINTSTNLPADKVMQTSTLPLSGCLLDTVPNALQPSKGLQAFTIKPGQDWSFNEHWNIIDEKNHICANTEYGGVCDMASRYQIAAGMLGLERSYGRHAGGLADIDYNDTVVIWSSGSYKRGGDDLIITNKTNKTAQFRVKIENNTMTVSAWLE